jgi:hypothetical protein
MAKAEQAVEPASGGGWLNDPSGSCDHDRVVLLTDVSGDGVVVSGRTVLWCADCEEQWWEDLSNVKQS